MYAVIALGGKQYRVRPGEKLVVDRLPHEEGATFAPPVLMAGDDSKTAITAAELASVTVSATVKAHVKGKKIRIYHYHPKHNWSRRAGHRSHQSLIEIDSIAV
jgi:large subunit ribosomal protein L21